MAEVITRFKLETTSYDSKLRDASKALADYTKQATLAGNEFAKVTQGNVEAARAFGNITTSANNAKDKVKELVGAFNTVANAYNNLTKEQQQSDFGKAMAESMTTLKGRIAEAKQEMDSTGGIMGQLAQKFTINIDALKLFNAGVTAAKAALDVAKDAFFASEANVDEWGRTIQSAQSVYEGFLSSINNGDVSGFLGRIDEIVKAAREAYNALDTLHTMQTIQAPGFAKQEAENNRFRMMIMTGRYIAPGDGRSTGGMKNGQLLTPDQIKRIEGMLQNGMKTIASLTGNELKQTGKAIDAYYNSLAKQNGMSLKEFREGTGSWGAFSEKMAGYEAYKKWNQQAQTEFARQGGRGYVDFDKNNPYAEFRKWGNFRVDKMGENSYNDLVNLIKQQQGQQNQLYSTMGQAYRTINRAEGITVKGIMDGGRTSGGSKVSLPEIGDFDKQLAKSLTGSVDLKETADMLSPYQMMLSEIKKNILDIKDADLGGALAEAGNNEVVEEINAMTNAVKQQQMAFNLAGQAANSFGAALMGIDDPAAKAAGQVTQAIASIALGFAMASSQANTAGTGWGWLAWLAAGASAMATTIGTIHSLTGYATGGEVKGNSYSGDQIPIMANAGEVILNRAQQGNLASQLQEQGGGGGYVPSHISGEQIYIALNRFIRRSGRGEIVTWKN